MENAVSTTIQPERILRELAELWVSLGKDADHGQSSGVLRACTMTLITLVEETEDPTDVWSTMAALMPEHPSRAMVIRVRESAARELASRVFSQCWMPFGHRRQICCEQIEISASDASLPDLAAVVLPLTVPDLPVILWCRSARVFGLPDFSQIAKIAQKLLLDSSGFADSAAILLEIGRRSRAGQVLGDLAWTRITGIRELISQIFESRNYLARLNEIADVKISFGGSVPPTAAYYLAAWLLDCLESAGAHPRLSWEASAKQPLGQLSRIEMAGGSEDGLHITICVSGDRERPCGDVQIDSLASHTVFPPDNDYVLLREELAIPGLDPVYEKSLTRAVALAGTEKQ
jgi:glucose-6-phosphate dehydrogenase assembly protein OpcA